MADVALLHRSLADAADMAYPLRTAPLAFGAMSAAFLVALSALAFGRAWRHGPRLFQCAFWAGAVFLALSCVQDHFATPRLPSVQRSCAAFLGAIRSGEVRWMPPDWQDDLSDSCGAGSFAAAANSPGSRYGARAG